MTGELLDIVEAAIAAEGSNEGRATVALSLVDGATLSHLKLCLAGVHERKTYFGQGVARGLEIAVAQIEHKHHHNGVIEKSCASDSKDGALQ